MPSTMGMIESFRHEVEAVAGESTAEQVMAGAETLKPGDAVGIARWMRGALGRLDELAGDHAGEVMGRCGRSCARVNHVATDRGKARRAKFKTEEAFIDAEMRKPQAGTRLERDDEFLYQVYTPATWRRPMRCYCGLMGALPADLEVSPTYCQCSRAFVETYWSEVLGRRVHVDVLETALTGSTECRFRIDLEPDAAEAAGQA